MRKNFVSITISTVVLMPVGSVAQEMPHLEPVGEISVEMVMDAVWDWIIAFNTDQPMVLGYLYTEGAQLHVQGQARIEGRTAIQAYWSAVMDWSAPLMTLIVEDVLDGIDTLFVRGEFAITERTTGLPIGHGNFEQIWLLTQDHRWQIDREIWRELEHEDVTIAALLRRIANLMPIPPLTPEAVEALRSLVFGSP